jgi:hypothetical protein
MEKGIDLQTFGDDALRARGKGSLSESKEQDFGQDQLELARVGKRQVLKVCKTQLGSDPLLTIVATIRFGEHDRFVVRSDVHLGKSTRVSMKRVWYDSS